MKRKLELAVARHNQDVTSEREVQTRNVVDVCSAVELMQDRETDLESIATQRFEARAHEMEMMMVGLTKSKDLKSQLLFEIMNQQEHDVEVMKVVPQERLQQRRVEQMSGQTADEPVPHTVEEIDEVVKFVPQERVQQHVAGQVVDVLVRQITDETIGVMKVVRPESVCDRIEERRWMLPYLMLWR